MKLTANEITILLRLVGAEQNWNEKYMGNIAEKANKELKKIEKKLYSALYVEVAKNNTLLTDEEVETVANEIIERR